MKDNIYDLLLSDAQFWSVLFFPVYFQLLRTQTKAFIFLHYCMWLSAMKDYYLTGVIIVCIIIILLFLFSTCL